MTPYVWLLLEEMERLASERGEFLRLGTIGGISEVTKQDAICTLYVRGIYEEWMHLSTVYRTLESYRVMTRATKGGD